MLRDILSLPSHQERMIRQDKTRQGNLGSGDSGRGRCGPSRGSSSGRRRCSSSSGGRRSSSSSS